MSSKPIIIQSKVLSKQEGGYVGRILSVDLSTKGVREETPPGKFYRDFIGGYGIGVRYIYSNQEAGVDPLEPENILGFTTGLLNGTGVPFAGRYTLVGKSPLTGTWGDANSGGFFGPELKKAGYDAVFIKGSSEKPVYLWINNGRVEIRDSNHLWGKDTSETLAAIQKELSDPKIRVACIGPSGEKQSLISCVINDKGRAAGRSGLGAVMGSKKLKAVAVRGTKGVKVADPERLKEVKERMLQTIKRKPSRLTRLMGTLFKPILPWLIRRGAMGAIVPDVSTIVETFRKYGTSGATAFSSESGDAPVKNWSGVGCRDFPMRSKSSKISDESVYRYVTKSYACAQCPFACGAIVKVDGGPYAVREAHRPEYETLASFGVMTLNSDVESIIKANSICNRFGLDTISAGSTISFAVECYENELVTNEQTEGTSLTWGNTEAILEMLEKMARREGFGELLADGVKKATERIGGNAGKYAMHVHGQELPMHDPRLIPSFGTTYVADPTPARHTAGGLREIDFMGPNFEGIELPKTERYQYYGKGEAHATMSNATQMTNSLGICYISAFLGKMPYVELIECVTGWKYSVEELLLTGERIQTLRQAFNVREGIKPSDIQLPDRVKGIPPLESGPTSGITIDVDSMKKEYYDAMDWSLEDGKPSQRRLEVLGLSDVAQELYS